MVVHTRVSGIKSFEIGHGGRLDIDWKLEHLAQPSELLQVIGH